MKLNIAVTAIIIDSEDRVLITRRHSNKKKWPGKWTVPGGQLEETDFLGTPTEINNQWYGTLENCVRREVKEEVGLRIDSQFYYLCNIAVPDTLIVSFYAYVPWSGVEQEVDIQDEECDDYAWVSVSELDNYDFIDGLKEEITEALGAY